MGPSNFPIQMTSFIGRERELAALQLLLDSSRLVTLTGVGGSGKTRLAIQLANLVCDSYADGVWLVDLVPLRDPALVPQLVAQALTVRPTADQPVLEILVEHLRPKQVLLLLDNCEHLKEACVLLARALLSQAPDLKIMATSREPLAIAGEIIYPVSGLAWPAMIPGQENIPKDLTQYDAIRLLVERARAIVPNFDLTVENYWSTVEICRRLDGLPLALELASARLNVLTVQEIADRLKDRFTLLISQQSPHHGQRHHTLRAAIDWSFALLTKEEQVLLRRLAVFAAGCSLDTAESVCSGESIAAKDILDLISTLVSKSLLVAETVGRPQARYLLLETIREYALEKLEECGETTRLRNRHLNHYLARAEEAAPKLGDAYQHLWLNWLEGELENLRAALAWALESAQIEAGLRIAIALVRFWEIRGYVQEGLVWFERLLAMVDDSISLAVHVNALTYASFLAMFLDKASAALAYGQAAVALAEAAGEQGLPVLPLALGALATGARMMRDFPTAFAIEERFITWARETGDEFYLGMSLLAHGGVAIELGKYAAARLFLDESLVLARQAGDAFRTAQALNSLGDLARCQGKYLQAKAVYEDSAALLGEIGAQRDLASVLQNLGSTCMLLGDLERACGYFREAMAAHQAQQNTRGKLDCLVGFAATAVKAGQPGPGMRLFAAAAALSGQPSPPTRKATSLEFERSHDLARASLTEADFQAEQDSGRLMTLEQAVSFALNLQLRTSPAPETGAAAGELTRREREVAALIGQGKTNSEIAAELVLSKRTVETHVGKILSKLGFSSRSQVMRWAIDHGLTKQSI